MLGFDIDDVIADTSTEFLRLLREKHNVTDFQREDWTSFKIKDCEKSVDIDIIIAIFDELFQNPLENGIQPMVGAIEGLKELRKLTPITLVTARPSAKPIHDWIRSLDAELADQIEVHATNNHDGKVQPLLDRNIKFFVDDRIETCRMIRDAGITPILYAQSWNSAGEVQRVNNWKELVPVVTQMVTDAQVAPSKTAQTR